jgi:DNA-binding transcriptional MerR regulator
MHPIGEAARRSGVGVETIRDYEREGIVPKPGRAASGRRLYSAAEIARLRFVRRCRDLGFTMADVRTLSALAEERGAPCGEVRAIGSLQLQAVRAKIAARQDLAAATEALLAARGPDDAPCPLLARLFAD